MATAGGSYNGEKEEVKIPLRCCCRSSMVHEPRKRFATRTHALVLYLGTHAQAILHSRQHTSTNVIFWSMAVSQLATLGLVSRQALKHILMTPYMYYILCPLFQVRGFGRMVKVAHCVSGVRFLSPGRISFGISGPLPCRNANRSCGRFISVFRNLGSSIRITV